MKDILPIFEGLSNIETQGVFDGAWKRFGQGQGEGHKYVNVLTIIPRTLLFLHVPHLKCIDDGFDFFSAATLTILFHFIFCVW